MKKSGVKSGTSRRDAMKMIATGSAAGVNEIPGLGVDINEVELENS